MTSLAEGPLYVFFSIIGEAVMRMEFNFFITTIILAFHNLRPEVVEHPMLCIFHSCLV